MIVGTSQSLAMLYVTMPSFIFGLAVMKLGGGFCSAEPANGRLAALKAQILRNARRFGFMDVAIVSEEAAFAKHCFHGFIHHELGEGFGSFVERGVGSFQGLGIAGVIGDELFQGLQSLFD